MLKVKNRQLIFYYILLFVFTLGIIFTFTFSVNIPHWDEWAVYPPLLEKFVNNQLTVIDLLKPVNEHQVFFPKLIYLFLGIVTKLDLSYFLLFLHLLFFGIMFIYFLVIKNKKNFPSWLFLILLCLCLSLRQYENMLLSLQIGFMSVVFNAFLSFYFFEKLIETKKLKNLWFVIFPAIIASFSSAMGLLVWPCLIIADGYLYFNEKQKQQKTIILKWGILLSIVGIVVWLIYNLFTPIFHSSMVTFNFFRQLLQYIAYFVLSLGNALYTDLYQIGVYGVVSGLTTLLYIYQLGKHKLFKQNIFVCLILFFGYFSISSIAFGRASISLGSALTSRYATFALLIINALLIIGYQLQQFGKFYHYWFIGFLILTVFGLVTNTGTSLSFAKIWRQSRLEEVEYVRKYSTQSETKLQRLHPDAKTVRHGAAFLDANHYSIWADTR